MAFKLKGWSGYQKPSPVNKLDLSNTLSKIQSTISNIVGGIKIKPNTGHVMYRNTSNSEDEKLILLENIEANTLWFNDKEDKIFKSSTNTALSSLIN